MKIVKLLQNVIRYSGETPQQIWKFKYFLMEGKLPLVGKERESKKGKLRNVSLVFILVFCGYVKVYWFSIYISQNKLFWNC